MDPPSNSGGGGSNKTFLVWEHLRMKDQGGVRKGSTRIPPSPSARRPLVAEDHLEEPGEVVPEGGRQAPHRRRHQPAGRRPHPPPPTMWGAGAGGGWAGMGEGRGGTRRCRAGGGGLVVPFGHPWGLKLKSPPTFGPTGPGISCEVRHPIPCPVFPSPIKNSMLIDKRRNIFFARGCLSADFAFE